MLLPDTAASSITILGLQLVDIVIPNNGKMISRTSDLIAYELIVLRNNSSMAACEYM